MWLIGIVTPATTRYSWYTMRVKVHHFRFLLAALQQRYDANILVSEVLLSALPTRQHGAFRLFEVLMREGRGYVRRLRYRERAASTLRRRDSGSRRTQSPPLLMPFGQQLRRKPR